MEENKEFKGGMITEEALEKVAGGLGITKVAFAVLLAGAGVGVAAVGIGAGIKKAAEGMGKYHAGTGLQAAGEGQKATGEGLGQYYKNRQ